MLNFRKETGLSFLNSILSDNEFTKEYKFVDKENKKKKMDSNAIIESRSQRIIESLRNRFSNLEDQKIQHKLTSIGEIKKLMRNDNVCSTTQKTVLNLISKLKDDSNLFRDKMKRRERMITQQRKTYFKELFLLREELFKKETRKDQSYFPKNFVLEEWHNKIKFADYHNIKPPKKEHPLQYPIDKRELNLYLIKNKKLRILSEKSKKLDKLINQFKTLQENYLNKVKILEKKEEIQKRIISSCMDKKNQLLLKEHQLFKQEQKVSNIQLKLQEEKDNLSLLNEKEQRLKSAKSKIREEKEKSELLQKQCYDLQLKNEELIESKKELSMKEAEKLLEFSQKLEKEEKKNLYFQEEIKKLLEDLINSKKENTKIKELQKEMEKSIKDYKKQLEVLEQEQEIEDIEENLDLDKIIEPIDEISVDGSFSERKRKKVTVIKEEIQDFQTKYEELYMKLDVVKKRMSFYQEGQVTTPKDIVGPTGFVTLVFTDIQDSTAIWEKGVEIMHKSMFIHNSIIRKEIEKNNGMEVKTEGDSFMVAFSKVKDALKFSMDIQFALLNEKWSNDLLSIPPNQKEYDKKDKNNGLIWNGFRVRVGIHCGNPICKQDPITRRTDYFGPMVNKSARIESTASGGQISISQSVYDNIKEILENDQKSIETFGYKVCVKSLGKKKLKGIKEDEIVRTIIPWKLRNREYKPKELKKQEKSMIDTVENLRQRKKELERKRNQIKNKIGYSMKLKNLVDSNRRKEELIQYLKKKVISLKKGKFHENSQNGDDEHEKSQKFSDVMQKYQKMHHQYVEIKNSFDQVEEIFNKRLKTEISKFSEEIANLQEVVRGKEKKNKFIQSLWEEEKKILEEDLENQKSIVKGKEMKIQALKQKIHKRKFLNSEDKNPKNDKNVKERIKKMVQNKNKKVDQEKELEERNKMSILLNQAISYAVELKDQYKQLNSEDEHLNVAKFSIKNFPPKDIFLTSKGSKKGIELENGFEGLVQFSKDVKTFLHNKENDRNLSMAELMEKSKNEKKKKRKKKNQQQVRTIKKRKIFKEYGINSFDTGSDLKNKGNKLVFSGGASKGKLQKRKEKANSSSSINLPNIHQRNSEKIKIHHQSKKRRKRSKSSVMRFRTKKKKDDSVIDEEIKIKFFRSKKNRNYHEYDIDDHRRIRPSMSYSRGLAVLPKLHQEIQTDEERKRIQIRKMNNRVRKIAFLSQIDNSSMFHERKKLLKELYYDKNAKKFQNILV